MRIISIINFKGGVGKSTLATNLAHALARSGTRVLLIDADLQGNSSSLLTEVTTPTLTQVLRGQADFRDAICRAPQGFDVLPSDHDLDTAAAHIVAAGRKSYYSLRREMERLNTYDVCLIDHSPSYSSVTEACLLASHEMLIPCELSPFSVEGLLAMFDKLNDVLIDHTLTMTGIVPFKLDRRMAMHTAYINDLRQTFGDKVLPAVRTDSTVSKAQSFHQSVFDYDPNCKAAADFTELAGFVAGAVAVPA